MFMKEGKEKYILMFMSDACHGYPSFSHLLPLVLNCFKTHGSIWLATYLARLVLLFKNKIYSLFAIILTCLWENRSSFFLFPIRRCTLSPIFLVFFSTPVNM